MPSESRQHSAHTTPSLDGHVQVTPLSDEGAFISWLRDVTGSESIRSATRLSDVASPTVRYIIVGLLEADHIRGSFPSGLLDACETVADLWEWSNARR
jgi:hypothetical protein